MKSRGHEKIRSRGGWGRGVKKSKNGGGDRWGGHRVNDLRFIDEIFGQMGIKGYFRRIDEKEHTKCFS